jgi:hypothetical protein
MGAFWKKKKKKKKEVRMVKLQQFGNCEDQVSRFKHLRSKCKWVNNLGG